MRVHWGCRPAMLLWPRRATASFTVQAGGPLSAVTEEPWAETRTAQVPCGECDDGDAGTDSSGRAWCEGPSLTSFDPQRWNDLFYRWMAPFTDDWMKAYASEVESPRR